MIISNILLEEVYNQLILEAKSREEIYQLLLKKYGDDFSESSIYRVTSIDPTKKYSYSQWAFKAMMNEDEDEYDGVCDETIDVLKRLFQFAQEHNDFQLQTFPTISSAYDTIEEYLGKEAYSVVYEDDGWIIYVPQTYEAERYIVWHLYGGASWCTAANSEYGRHYFGRYNTNDYKLYINANKQTKDIYQYSPKSGEFNDSSNDEIVDFDNIGITEGAKLFYKETLHFDIDSYQQETLFDENANWLNDYVALFDGQLWLSWDEQLSDGSVEYSDDTWGYYSSKYCILAPYSSNSENKYLVDVYVNQDDMTGEDLGWHLEYKGLEIIDDTTRRIYGKCNNYFGYIDTDEGWFDCIDGVAEAEKLVDLNPNGFWIITHTDGTLSLYSSQLDEWEYEYNHNDIMHDGIDGFGDMLADNINSMWIKTKGVGYIVIDKDYWDYFKKILQVLDYTDVKVKEYQSDTNYLIIYDTRYNCEDEDMKQEDLEQYAKRIGDELGVNYGVDVNYGAYILVPRNTPREELNTIHNYLINKFGKYKMLPQRDMENFRISINPVEMYNFAESIKAKFDVILENISKNYNADKILD